MTRDFVSRRARAGAWAIILALAAFQAYANRYAISPDGVSYLDLSDAVVTGRWSSFVNLYWSPLYPFLIGIARMAFGAGAAREAAIVHAVNVSGLVAMVAAFEYFFIPVLILAGDRRGSALAMRYGPVAAYALFGCLALTMTPLELTTPDLFSNAAIFLALGALLRLRDTTPADRRNAIIFGAALGIGALAKSFLVPWAIVCFATLVVIRRRLGVRPIAYAIAAWLLFVAPWAGILSARAGRLTFGDAGRLTYAWYVNGIDTPSLGVVPSGARTPATDALLPGVGVVGDAPGTDPMWFDPVRWNAPIAPKWSLHDQAATLETMSLTLINNFSLLAFAVFLLAVAPRGSRRRAWSDAWPVIVPCIAGIVAYCMVIVTSRYIMAFAVAALLMLLAVLPLPRRLRPTYVLLGIVLTIGAQAMSPVTAYGLSFVVATAVAMCISSVIAVERGALWFTAVTLSVVLSVMLLSPTIGPLLRIVAALVGLVLWMRARSAVSRHVTVAFTHRVLAGMAYALTLIFAGRLALRAARDVNAMSNAASGNPQMQIAEDLQAHGVATGSRVAVIGPHAEAYWARAARVKIVANVPNPLTPVWWMVGPARRDELLTEFSRAGAQFAIATRLPDDGTGAPDSSWTPLRYRGLMRRLSPPSR